MKYILISFIVVISSSSLAFDWDKCRKAAGGQPYFNTFYTTTSYISSTGDCSMMGEIQHDKKVFIVQNYLELKSDIAKGDGEYIEAYASLSKCTDFASKELRSLFKKSYTDIFGPATSNEINKSYEVMNSLENSNSIIKIGCGTNS